MHDDAAIQDIQRKIEREKAIINAATQMARATNNAAVNARVDSSIRDARRNIQYFEQTLGDLQARRVGGDLAGLSLRSGSAAGSAPPTPRHGGSGSGSNNQLGHGGGSGDYGDAGPGGYALGGRGVMPPNAPYAPPGPDGRSRDRPHYSKLDLIKDDTPHLGPRIQLMLSQLQFKLSVERQYKDGIEKMVRLYQMEGDRKSKADAEGRRVESNQKMQLLTRALRRYEDLHIDVEGGPEGDDDGLDTPTQRKPLTGHLSVRVHAVADVEHASYSRLARGPETFVVMKVEDTFKGRTKATRTGRWTDEVHDFDVDKANEIEFVVYDKSNDQPTPIGLLWIRLSDLVDEIRRKRVENEFNQAGWMTADKMEEPRPEFQPPPGSSGAASGGSTAAAAGGPQGSGLQVQTAPISIDAWFSLEPVGRIHLTLGFVKQNKDRRPFVDGLNRMGAVRQKKENVVEQYGHKFTVQTFYNIMRCALCGDFLKYTAGMQCADCKYTCHKNCFRKVVTKCISKSNAETDPDEEKINHRIPHRFEPFSNMGANWCCHCGYMLPLGKKQSRRCTECKLTCHASCTHFIPDFCGMSMESANQILLRIKETRGRMGDAMRPPPSPAPAYRRETTSEDSKATSRYSYPPEAEGGPPPRTSHGAPSHPIDAARISMGVPSSPESPSRPATAGRAQSSHTAAMAAQAAIKGQPERPVSHRGSTETRGYRTEEYEGYRPPSQSKPYQAQAYNPGAYANVSKYSALPPYPSSASAGKPPSYQAHPPPASAAAARVPPSVPVVQPPSSALEERKAPPVVPPSSGRRIGLDHFNFLAVLGKGNFGKVMLAETKSTKQLYAIKVLKKEFIIENDEVESTRSEKRVFLIANKERHPFLINLHACFQTETRIYFVMEYIAGGDLMLHIQRGMFGTKRAQFYAAEVCLALKYFHENGVIYRDLKLDNIMLTLDGHIKIADYGLCKEDMWYGSTTSTFCGTPEFMAPEILLDKKYGRAVDWWAFGVLIYQMLLQQSPFRGEDEDEIYDAILADEPLYPIHMPRDSVSILQKLLTREPEMRLGSGPTDAQEIMSHAFFRNVNWDDIYHKRVPVPFVPQVKSRADTSNFDPEFTSVTPVLTPVQSVLSPESQEKFRGFTYAADFA
ncbi:hypothetical protein K470DRAFT_249697 [Piedraia hortae CBS 480.64]|uniref:protein kinase C n=1 Tax=Piedraia hortae CBS 480.64 TaxID=1314780 RepID=A0A6A7BW60_9PEZI|nr:hypothetical protein K470DRAFT_249697 [Piedraia hortae CBS 480.64]